MASGPALAHPDYRPDIDGLRAVAVLSVLAYHAFPGVVPGGFVGVDVFFVISGFLISSILFGSLARGAFSIADFYVRRVRRIFPALLLVLGACFAFGWIALYAGEYRELGKHIASGAGFLSNLVLWQEAGYFDAAAEAKPLLHLWSLGVEEQFYIAWPLLAALLWKRPRWRLPILLGLALASFAWAVFQVRHAPVAAFYSPLTRFWELMAGAILAWLSLRAAGTPDRLSILRERWPGAPQALATVGAVLLGAGLWVVDHRTPFPGAAALPPVLGAVCVIAAGPRAWLNRWVLAHPAAVWVGLISYPLYLWHWPLLSFARIVQGEVPLAPVRAAAMAAAIVLAWLTYRYVERPVRTAAPGRRPALALASAMLAVGVVGWGTMASDGVPSRMAGRADASQLGWNGDQRDPLCVRVMGGGAEFCRLSADADPTLVVIGDSVAWQLYFGLADEARRTGDTVLAYMHGGCSAFLGYSSRFDYQECERVTRKALEVALEKDSVRAVVLSAAPRPFTNAARKVDLGIGPGGSGPFASRDAFEQSAQATFDALLTRLREKGKRVVYVRHAVQLSFEPGACLARPFMEPKRAVCAEPLGSYAESEQGYADMVRPVLRQHPEVGVLDLASLLCDDMRCWAMRDGKLLYRDQGHLSLDGSRLVGPAIGRLLQDPARR